MFYQPKKNVRGQHLDTWWAGSNCQIRSISVVQHGCQKPHVAIGHLAWGNYMILKLIITSRIIWMATYLATNMDSD